MIRASLVTIVFVCFHAYILPNRADAFELWCKVERKLNQEMEYGKKYIDEQRFGLFIRHSDTGASLSRCSGSSACDEYQVDHVEYAQSAGIVKYYHFRGHFDVQLYPDLTFIENNGRGDIAWGKCWQQ